MGTETERKFLVRGDWPREQPVHIRQGYLSRTPERTVRIRRAGDRAFLTIKGMSRGASRAEFEYPIPVGEADQMLDELCEAPLIDKHRYRTTENGVTWEIDEFHGANDGLVIAEVELHSEDQPLTLPSWVGAEVTGDARFFNANLVASPYSQWRGEEG